MAEGREARQRLAPQTQDPSSLASGAVCRQILEVGAQCGSAARWELSGGRGVTRVPTGIARTIPLKVEKADKAVINQARLRKNRVAFSGQMESLVGENLTGALKVIELTIALVLFLFPLAYSPGPGNMFFAANGARFGFRATLMANVGYHVATWIVTIAIGFGFLAAIERSPELFNIVRWAGSAYVLYLAWKFIKAGALEDTGDARPAGFVDGVVLLVLNPKAYVIIVLMFSQFLVETTFERTVAVFLISTIFTLNNLVAFAAWAAVGDQIAGGFRDETSSRRLNLLFGLVLSAVAIWMMLG